MNPHARVASVALAGLLLMAVVAEAQTVQQRRGFSVAITAPANQELVLGKTRIAVDVKIEDPEFVDRVEFFVGDELIFVDREAPYECFHDFGDESRSWIVRAVAHHIEEVTVTDVVITRKINFGEVEHVNNVILWISATDEDGNLVTDLGPEDFEVYENGDPQRVVDFYHEQRPIHMAILIDTSGSMLGKIDEVHDAAGAFVDSLREIDQALVIDFDENVFLIQDLTAEREALQEAIRSTEPLGATALYDALHAAYRKIGTIDGRKVVVLLSDGDDTSSQFGYDRVLYEAKTNTTMLFTIGLGIEGRGPRKDVLKEFAENTGGTFHFVKQRGQLAEAYEKIARELGQQYFLTYDTTNDEWDGRWMKVQVESRRPGVNIKARKGYFAVRSRGLRLSK